MSAKYKSPSFLLPNELNTSANTANDTGINSLYSMNFDSVNLEHINLGIISEINGLTNFSFSIWMKPTFGAPLEGKLVFGNRDVNNSYRGVALAIGNRANQVSYFYLTSATGTIYLNLGANIWTENAWNHFTVTYDGSQLKAYINNGSPITGSVSGATISSTAPFYIGREVNQGSQNFRGQLDEFCIFNKALNDNERAALYEGTGSNIRPSNLMASNLNPVAYYPLGEQAQNTGYLTQEITNGWQFPNGVLQDYVMDFDGSNQYIKIGSFNEFSVASISFWAKTTATNYKAFLSFKSNYEILANGSGNFNIGNSNSFGTNWEIYRDGNLVRTQSQGGQNEFLSDGNWHHYVIRDLRIASSTNYTNVLLGTDQTEAFFYQGELSNFQIFNSALPATGSNSVQTLYNNGSPLTSMSGFTSLTNWWKLNATSVYTPSAPNYTKALSFNGSTDYIDAGSSVGAIGTGVRTFSVWLKTSSNAIQTILGTRNVNTDGWVIQWNQPGILFFNPLGGTNKGILSTTGNAAQQHLIDGNWHHIVIVRAGSGNNKIYVDGVSQTLNTAFGDENLTNPQSSKNLLIGAGYNTGGALFRYFDGEISNTAIFNTALTPSQVSTLFNFGTPETNISFSPQAWWKLDDQTTITDSSGNGNTGTNNGATNAPGGVAVTPSWKIPSALPITTPNYTTVMRTSGNVEVYTEYPTSLYDEIKDTNIFTISTWVNFTTNTYFYKPIIAGNNNTSDILIVWSNGNLNVTRGGVGGGIGITFPNPPKNRWYNLTFVFTSATNVDNYVDGKLIGSATVAATVNTTTSLRLNDSTYTSAELYQSNFMVWDNKSLTASEVDTVFNNGTPLSNLSSVPQNSSLICWNTLINNSTTSGGGYFDNSGNNNNGSTGGTSSGLSFISSDVLTPQPVNGVSTTLPSTALQQSDLQFDSPFSNYSLSFDGTSYIDCGDSDVFSFGNGTTDSAFSVSAWAYIDTLSNFTILTKGVYSTTGEWHIRMTGANQMHLVLYDGADYEACIINETLSTGQWYHFAFTYDGRGGASANDGIIGYLNGSPATLSRVDSGSYVAMTNSTAPLYIAKNGSNYSNGKLDETAIFNTELTSAQVLEIYNNGRPKDLTTFSGTAPISWWRLGENAYFNDVPAFTVPNSISGAPNGTGSGSITTMISADAPGTYANGIGTNLDILDRVGDAALSTSNSQSYNMIPSDISPYVPQYVGDQIANNFSMNFDSASSDYINVGTSDLVSGIFSVSMWIKRETTGQMCLISKDDVSSNRTFNAYFNNSGALNFFMSNTGAFLSNKRTITNNTITDTNWHHLVFINNGDTTNSQIFIDGTEATYSTHNTGISNLHSSSVENKIGTQGSGSYYFKGKIDEVAIFDTALNAGQIYNDIYQPTATGTNQTADFVNNPNLPNPVAWYRMGD